MAFPLRPADPLLIVALDNPIMRLWKADLFTFTLQNGDIFKWTSWNRDVPIGSDLFSSQNPWLERTKWSLTNTMQIPEMTVTLRALNEGFNGGANIKLQIHNGAFDGASFLLQTAYTNDPNNMSALGSPMDIFGGVVGAITVDGIKATINVKGKNNLLDQYAPHNIYQTGCLHGFCDAGCTLNRASFTTSYTLGSSPTATFLPWSGSPPANPVVYIGGSVTFTSGAASGQTQDIGFADATGIFLAYPLYSLPSSGDTFDAFQGCDKTLNSGSGQSCTDYSNTQNYFGYPFVPPPNTAY